MKIEVVRVAALELARTGAERNLLEDLVLGVVNGPGLSKVAEGFIAGLLQHAHEITAITNQTVSSYKRLVRFERPST